MIFLIKRYIIDFEFLKSNACQKNDAITKSDSIAQSNFFYINSFT
jgi:hypothetical protein